MRCSPCVTASRCPPSPQEAQDGVCRRRRLVGLHARSAETVARARRNPRSYCGIHRRCVLLVVALFNNSYTIGLDTRAVGAGMCGASWLVRLEPGRGALGDARTNFLGMEQYGLSRQAAIVTAIRRPPLRLAGGWEGAEQRVSVPPWSISRLPRHRSTKSLVDRIEQHRAESGSFLSRDQRAEVRTSSAGAPPTTPRSRGQWPRQEVLSVAAMLAPDSEDTSFEGVMADSFVCPLVHRPCAESWLLKSRTRVRLCQRPSLGEAYAGVFPIHRFRPDVARPSAAQVNGNLADLATQAHLVRGQKASALKVTDTVKLPTGGMSAWILRQVVHYPFSFSAGTLANVQDVFGLWPSWSGLRCPSMYPAIATNDPNQLPVADRSKTVSPGTSSGTIGTEVRMEGDAVQVCTNGGCWVILSRYFRHLAV